MLLQMLQRKMKIRAFEKKACFLTKISFEAEFKTLFLGLFIP